MKFSHFWSPLYCSSGLYRPSLLATYPHQYWTMEKLTSSTTILLFSWWKLYIYFGVGYGECVHPHTPAAPLVLDGMVEKNPEDVVNHLSDLLLLWVLRVNVAEREHPILPNGTLQQTPVTQKMRWIKLAAVTRVKSSLSSANIFFNILKRHSRLEPNSQTDK